MVFSLELVEAHLHDRVASIAQELDHRPEALRQEFQALGQCGWLGLKVPASYQGLAISQTEFQQFQELVARYSGALAFLQAQHQSAGAFLSRSENEVLKQEYLPQMSSGAAAIGVAFSHLRRSGTPALQAAPVQHGYELNGSIP